MFSVRDNMQFQFTPDQHELVLQILQNRLDELRQEIRHSTVSTFTQQLKEVEKLLKKTIHQLECAESQNLI